MRVGESVNLARPPPPRMGNANCTSGCSDSPSETPHPTEKQTFCTIPCGNTSEANALDSDGDDAPKENPDAAVVVLASQVGPKLDALESALQRGWMPGLLTKGVLGVPQNPLTPHRGPPGPAPPDRKSAIGDAPALVPGPLA